MKGHSFIFAALLAATCFTAQAEDKIWNIEIENPSNKAKVDEPVVLDLRQLLGDNSMFCESRPSLWTKEQKFHHSLTT